MNGILYIKNSIVQIAESNDLTIEVFTKSKNELAEMANAFIGTQYGNRSSQSERTGLWFCSGDR
ncbi:hypothetical protein [Psychromonas hadalis]|uniref:hypothetical protein n=1 Tax=Psychromonas hadalis TaxID=211669 RepID=UPI0003B52475|nr:hypothetical protein [Psychromonas hadalis]